MSQKRGKAQAKEVPVSPLPAKDNAPARPHASSSSSSTGHPLPAKAKLSLRTAVQVNIAALAARNLGGFVPNKIFVGGVPITCTEEQFKSYFETFGAISKVELHALRGFGYITYETIEAVDTCLEKYGEHYLCKKWVEVKRSIPRELIDAYEREQKRLLAEHTGGSDDASTPTAKSDHGASQNASGSTPTAKAHHPAPTTVMKRPSGADASNSAPAGGASGASGAPAWGLPAAGGKGAGKGTSGAAPRGVAPSTGAPTPKAKGGGGPSGPAAAGAPAPGSGWGASARVGAGQAGHIKQLQEMGFSEQVARRVLAECVWDVNKAIDRLLTSPPPEEEPEPPTPPTPAPEAATSTPPSNPNPKAGAAAPPVRTTPAAVAATQAPPSPGAQAVAPTGTAREEASSNRGAAAVDDRETANQENGNAEAAPSVEKDAAAVLPAAEVPPKSEERTPEEAVAQTASVAHPAAAVTPPEALKVMDTPQNQAAAAVHATPAPVASTPPQQQQNQQAAASAVGVAVAAAPTPPRDIGVPVAVPGAPKKRLEKVSRPWAAEDGSQLNVVEGDFVNVWVETRTDHGWIHAEISRGPNGVGGEVAGWLPTCVLATLEEGKRYMRLTQRWEAMDSTQCGADIGFCVLVWIGSTTPEGWVHVEKEQPDGSLKPGWLPVFCLEWTKD